MNETKVLFISLVFFLATTTAYAAALTSQTLKNDIAYYQRITREKNLNVNDRYFVLSRIREKYNGWQVNLAPLAAEIDLLARPPANTQAGDGAHGTVEKILVSESESESRVTITATGVKRSNYFLMRDPDPSLPPMVVLDLYGAKETLSEKAKNIALSNGLFSRVRAGQFEDAPDYIVRIVAEMRKESPYKIKKDDTGWLIIAEKKPAPAAAAPQNDVVAAKTEKAPLPVAAPETVASTAPAPGEKSSVGAQYRIEAGDILSVAVYPAEELSREVVVQPDGKIPFALIGSAEAKGNTPDQLSEQLSKNLGRFISNPQVTVSVRQFSRRQVFVTGEVRTPGAYNYKENLRLMEFISSAGGFAENADRKSVKIFRGPPTRRQTHNVNIEEIVRSGDFSKDFLLEPGDIIEVPKGRARVAILGDVRNPGYYDYRENMQLLELISLAGGFSDTAQIAKVTVLHPGPEPGAADKTLLVNLNKTLSGQQKDKTIAPGDTVYVPKKAIATANWFATTILPWLSLISLVFVIRGGI